MNISKDIRRKLDEAWLGIDIDESLLLNPLEIITNMGDKSYMMLTYLMMQPEYFGFLCKELLAIELTPMQMVMLYHSWKRKFPMWIGSRGLSKSFLEGVYCLLRALLIPNRNIIICGSVFRQSKIVFEYIERIYKNSPRLQEVCEIGLKGAEKVLSKDTDMWKMRIGQSNIMSVPVGNTGEGVRGLRANDLIVEEFAAHNREIFEVILSGFTAVSADPLQKVKIVAAERLAQKLGISIDAITNPLIPSNQLLLCGTAYYQFNHFYDYWKKWRVIIETKGDKEKVRAILGDNAIEGSLNPNDYVIFRIPVELIPAGFMDESQIARSKASMHSGNYGCEFGACSIDENELIQTPLGYVPYKNIKINDLVLTHKGRFQKVISKTQRLYDGLICKIDTIGTNISNYLTIDHEFWNNDHFIPIGPNQNYLSLARLNELNGLNEIDIANYVQSAIIYDKYLYTKYPNQQMDQKILNKILSRLKECNNQSQIAREFKIDQSQIHSIKRNNIIRKKCALNRYIKVDYYLGLIIGYYAAEGSVDADGRSTSFALDSHEELFIKQLSDAIFNVFGIKCKIYKRDNYTRINVNSRIFGEFIKHVCPGDVYSKYINPEFLFSNESFILGFLEGIFNGDGCIFQDSVATIQLTSLSLITQIRLILTYFKIYSSFYLVNKKSTGYIKDKLVSFNKTYRLNIKSEFLKTFLKLIYGYDIKKSRSYNKISDDRFLIKIKSIEKIEYHGMVYNLEVEKDHTYSGINYTAHNCFQNDSSGFFKRSLIESCVASEKNNIINRDGKIVFHPTLIGNHDNYVMAIDPASEHDNFAIVILEIHPTHRRIVYCWTITRKEQKKRMQDGLIKENDFYRYCTMKIRELMRNFNIVRIAIDSQGGRPISEALSSLTNLMDDELPIYEIIDPTNYKDSDSLQGLHIIEMINFSDAIWTSDANHGMRKDFEDKILLFPHFDPLSIEFAAFVDRNKQKMYDTLEDCVAEIEELKDELSTIVISTTATGRERWDTPDSKIMASRKGRMRKDRYSALLMANASAKLLSTEKKQVVKNTIGGFSHNIALEQPDKNKILYSGPLDIVKQLEKLYEGV